MANAFRKDLTDTYELDEDVVENMVKIFIKHSGTKIEDKKENTLVEEVPNKGKVSSWIVFRGEKAKELKDEYPNGKERLKAISEIWKNMSVEEKQPYKDKAIERNNEN